MTDDQKELAALQRLLVVLRAEREKIQETTGMIERLIVRLG